MQKISDREWEFGRDRIKVILKRGGVIVSRRKAGQLAGITQKRTQQLFDKYPELEELRKATIKNIKTTSMQNIVDILEDPTHKDHFAATKEMLKKYKTEFDEVLEATDVDPAGTLSGASISITFAKPDEDVDED